MACRRLVGAALAFKPMQVVKQMTSAIAGVKEYQYGKEKNLPVDILMFSMDFARLLPKLILEGVSLGKYKGPVSTMIEDSATSEEAYRGQLRRRPIRLDQRCVWAYEEGDSKGLHVGSESPQGLGPSGRCSYVSRRCRGGDGVSARIHEGHSERDVQGRGDREVQPIQQDAAVAARSGEGADSNVAGWAVLRLLTAFTSSQLLYLNEIVTTANNMLQVR